MPPAFISLMLIMSIASCRIPAIASCGEWTDSSAITGIGTPARTRFIPSQSHDATGCSQSSIPSGAIARHVRIASAGVQPWFASIRIRTSGPTASRTAASLRSSISGDSPTFTLTTRNPAATASRARPAIASGASREIVRSVSNDSR